MIIKWKWGGQSKRSDKQRLNAYSRQFIISLFTSNASPSGEHIHPCEGDAMTTPTKAPAHPEAAAVSGAPITRKFTVEEYYRMAEVGILLPDERVELIWGEILLMAPIGPEHVWSVNRWNRIFAQVVVEGRVVVQIQSPVRLADDSQPEPDVALLSPQALSHPTVLAGPENILLVIEVLDTTLSYDRGTKVQIYAEANISETWIMNLVEDCIESFTGPGPGGYSTHTIYRRGDRFSPSMLPDVEFAVDDLLLPVVGEARNEEGEEENPTEE